jgi:hypothetical protein
MPLLFSILSLGVSSSVLAGEALTTQEIQEELQKIADLSTGHQVSSHIFLTAGGTVAGKTLRSTFHVDAGIPLSLQSMRTFHAKGTCAIEQLHPLFQAGAVMEFLYARPDGEELGLITVDQTVCETEGQHPMTQLEKLILQTTFRFSPARLNDNITSTMRDAAGTVLKATYQVDPDVLFSLERLHVDPLAEICDDIVMLMALKAGATIEFIYTRPDGEELGRTLLAEGGCDELVDAR